MDSDDPWSPFPPEPDDPAARCSRCDYEGPFVDAHALVVCESWPLCPDLTHGGVHDHGSEITADEAALLTPESLQAGWNRMTAAQEQLRVEGGDYMNMIEVAKRSLG